MMESESSVKERSESKIVKYNRPEGCNSPRHQGINQAGVSVLYILGLN